MLAGSYTLSYPVLAFTLLPFFSIPLTWTKDQQLSGNLPGFQHPARVAQLSGLMD